MYSDKDCFEIRFDFYKHLHLKDVSFEEALRLLSDDFQSWVEATNLAGIDLLGRMGTADLEYLSSREFIDCYTKLPIYSYGTVKAHKYLIENEIIEKSFISVKRVVDAFAEEDICRLVKQISVQDFEIRNKLMFFSGSDENAPRKKLLVDNLGLYYWGRLKACGENDSFECPMNGWTQIPNGPQIIIDSNKIFRSSIGGAAEFLMTVVVLHELMHAVLDPRNYGNEDRMSNGLLYHHIKEEAWANAMTLMAIKSAGMNELLNYAIEFMKSQPKDCGYQYGIKLFRDHTSDWRQWIEEKAGSQGRDLDKEKRFIEEVEKFKA